MIFSKPTTLLSLLIAVSLAVRVPCASGIVSTNVGFNTSYFARQSTEGQALDESALTEVERQRLERIRQENRIRALPMEEVIAFGEPDKGHREAQESPVAEERVESERPSSRPSRWRAEHLLLAGLLLAVVGVLCFGGGKKR